VLTEFSCGNLLEIGQSELRLRHWSNSWLFNDAISTAEVILRRICEDDHE
jgi:hypothetical protein